MRLMECELLVHTKILRKYSVSIMFPILSPEVETFLTVSRAGSFTKAADALFITPTAVMKRIDKLEKGIGAELFRRFKTGVELTDAGELFFRSCEAI